MVNPPPAGPPDPTSLAPGSGSGSGSVEDPVLLSVVLPCLNEAETLETVIRKALGSIAALGIVGEVVVADNGSTDGSQDIARGAGARVVDVPVRGYGAALQAGIRAARGEYVIMADADDSYALEDLGPFVAGLDAGADLVMGNRFAGGIAPGAMPFLHRYLGNPVLSYLGRLFFRLEIHDFHCGMRAFRKDAVTRLGLQTTGMEFASEMVVRSALGGLRIDEVPTTLRPDGRSRQPHLRTWRDGWRHLKFLLAFSPRWLFLYPGLVLFIVGLLGALVLVGGPVTLGAVTFDVQSFVVACTSVILGVQLGVLALTARAFASSLGILPESRSLTRFLSRFAVDHGVLLGAALMLCGVVGFVVAVSAWSGAGFGDLPPAAVRLPIAALTLVVTGGQILMVSFVLSLTSFHTPRVPSAGT